MRALRDLCVTHLPQRNDILDGYTRMFHTGGNMATRLSSANMVTHGVRIPTDGNPCH